MSHDQLVNPDQSAELLEALSQAEVINFPTVSEAASTQVYPLDQLFVIPQESPTDQGELAALLVEHEAVIVDIAGLIELRRAQLNNDDRGAENVA